MAVMQQASQSPRMYEFLQDAKRFVRLSISIIQEAPLQTYCSALVFSPQNSIVRKQFLNQIPHWIRRDRLPPVEQDWGPCLQVLGGQADHNPVVVGLAFSPDSRLLASASMDGTVTLWDLAVGALKFTLRGHSHPVTAVAFSPSGQLLVSASYDGTLVFWDPLDGTHRRILTEGVAKDIGRFADIFYFWWDSERFPSAVLCFSPDGKTLASAAGNTITLRCPGSGTPWHFLKHHENNVTALSFSPDGKILASSAKGESTVLFWDSYTGQKQLSGVGADSSSVKPSHFHLWRAEGFLPSGLRMVPWSRSGILKDKCSDTF